MAVPAAGAPPPRETLRLTAPGAEARVPAGGLVGVTHHARGARTARTFVLARTTRRRPADPVLGRRTLGVRRTLTLRIPARTAPGTYRLLACAGTRCRAAAGRVRVIARAVAGPPMPPAPPAIAASVAPPPPPPPPAPPAPAPPAPASAPAPPASSSSSSTIRECGLPAAGDDAPADDVTRLFASARTGWSGGDGTFSVRLPDGRTLWLFGDSFVGGVTDDGRRDGSGRWVRNALVVQQGDCLTTLLRGPQGFLSSPEGTVLWPSQAVVEGDTVRAFFTRVRVGPGPWDLVVTGSVLVTLRLADLEVVAQRELPARGELFWGAAVWTSGGWTHVFGVDPSTRRLHLARAAGGLDGAWSFWDGARWSADVADARPVLAADVATQLSVVEDADGGLLLATQPGFDAPLTGWRATAPQGPWTPQGALATPPPVPSGAYSYNALLHPEFGGTLVSWNVNGESAFEDAAIYRPRFTRVVDSTP